MSKDSNVRAGIIFSDGEKFLIGHAPNKRMEDNTWDLPKGHIHQDEDYIVGALREFKEETGFDIADIDSDVVYVDKLKYGSTDLYLIGIKVSKLPDISTYHCESYFDWYGRRLPEIKEYKYIYFDEYSKYLYNSLCSPFNSIISKVKKCFSSD